MRTRRFHAARIIGRQSDGGQSCEHTFLTAQPHARVRFQRAIEQRALWMAEDAAREMGVVALHEAQQLLRLYAERRPELASYCIR